MPANDRNIQTNKNLIEDGQRKIQRIIKEIIEDYEELYKFAYELRKQDCLHCMMNNPQIGQAINNPNQSHFTDLFLKPHLPPSILDIIVQNMWND